MFVKLLKHEWRTNRGLIGLLCAVIGGSGLLSGGILRYTVWYAATGNEAVATVYAFVLAVALVAGVVCCVLPMYLLVHRFYQSRFTDRGYLMLTLPVSTHQQLLSSIVCTVIGVALVSVTALASYAAAIAIFLGTFSETFTAELVQNVESALAEAGTIAALQIDYMGLQLLITFLADIILLMLAFTVGAQSNKHPVLKGVAVYILTDLVVSEACTWIGERMDHNVIATALTCLIYGILAVAAYYIMHHIIDKRLNLT